MPGITGAIGTSYGSWLLSVKSVVKNGRAAGARIAEQPPEHDVIVRAPLRAPVLAIEVLLADNAIEAVRDEIRFEIRELELAAVVERRVVPSVLHVLGEPGQPRRARG